MSSTRLRIVAHYDNDSMELEGPLTFDERFNELNALARADVLKDIGEQIEAEREAAMEEYFGGR